MRNNDTHTTHSEQNIAVEEDLEEERVQSGVVSDSAFKSIDS